MFVMKHEQLAIWQRSFSLSCLVYKSFKQHRDYGFRDQICRSGLSVPSNIAEGLERTSDKEKAHFLAVAKGSLAELRTQLLIAIEIQYIPQRIGQDMAEECLHLSRMLGAFIVKLRG